MPILSLLPLPPRRLGIPSLPGKPEGIQPSRAGSGGTELGGRVTRDFFSGTGHKHAWFLCGVTMSSRVPGKVGRMREGEGWRGGGRIGVPRTASLMLCIRYRTILWFLDWGPVPGYQLIFL